MLCCLGMPNYLSMCCFVGWHFQSVVDEPSWEELWFRCWIMQSLLCRVSSVQVGGNCLCCQKYQNIDTYWFRSIDTPVAVSFFLSSSTASWHLLCCSAHIAQTSSRSEFNLDAVVLNIQSRSLVIFIFEYKSKMLGPRLVSFPCGINHVIECQCIVSQFEIPVL